MSSSGLASIARGRFRQLAELAQTYEKQERADNEIAQFGDMEIYRRQLRAIRSDGDIRLSEHEHISARNQLFLMTLDPNSRHRR